jgi:hypothetical protein
VKIDDFLWPVMFTVNSVFDYVVGENLRQRVSVLFVEGVQILSDDILVVHGLG